MIIFDLVVRFLLFAQVFSADGEFLFKFGSHGEGNGQFNAPTGVAVDANGNIIVADWGNSRIQVIPFSNHSDTHTAYQLQNAVSGNGALNKHIGACALEYKAKSIVAVQTQVMYFHCLQYAVLQCNPAHCVIFDSVYSPHSHTSACWLCE